MEFTYKEVMVVMLGHNRILWTLISMGCQNVDI